MKFSTFHIVEGYTGKAWRTRNFTQMVRDMMYLYGFILNEPVVMFELPEVKPLVVQELRRQFPWLSELDSFEFVSQEVADNRMELLIEKYGSEQDVMVHPLCANKPPFDISDLDDYEFDILG